MKNLLLLISATILACTTLWVWAYQYSSYNHSHSYSGYSYGWYSHSSYNRVCWFDGHRFRTFNSARSLRNQRNYIYAYSGSCSNSRSNSYRTNAWYYSKNYNSGWEPKRYYGSTFNPNLRGCPVYTMRTLVPQCYYKYTTNNLGCTRPVIHCEGRVRNKFIDNNTYWFQSNGFKTEAKTCPKFNLSAVVDGCEYKYIQNEDGCDIPKLVCGKDRVYKKTKPSLQKNSTEVTPIFDIIE